MGNNKNYRISEESWPQVIKRYKELKSVRVTAEEYGVSEGCIYQILVRSKVPRIGTPPNWGQTKIPKSEWGKIKDRYKECGSTGILAAEFGVDRTTIYKLLDNMKVERRGIGKRIPNSEWGKVRDKYKECGQLVIVAAEYGVSPRTIGRILYTSIIEKTESVYGRCLPGILEDEWGALSEVYSRSAGAVHSKRIYISPNNMDEGLSEDQLREFLIKAGFDYDEEE